MELTAQEFARQVANLADAVGGIATTGNLAMRVSDESGSNLEPLIFSLNSALERIEIMYAALESVVIKQRHFIADASHEMRTPLTTISSSLEAMSLMPEMSSEERSHLIDNAFSESQQLKKLVDDMLLLATLDFGGRLQPQEFSWSQFLNDTVTYARGALEPRILETTLETTNPTAYGDVNALQKALFILIDNVAEHTPQSSRAWLTETTSDDGLLCVVVADDGPGVPPSKLEDIFNRFVTVDPSRHQPGAGLGLAIARAIATEHGGTLDARLRDDGGIAFRMSIPSRPQLKRGERRRAPRPSP